MKSPLRPFLLILSLAAVPDAQGTLYVDDDTCPAAGTGTSGEPFCSIQAAIDAASSGDTVRVRPGVYSEAIDFSGKGVRVLATEGPEVTFLRTNGLGAVVTFASNEGPDAVLEGFTVDRSGGRGILCDGSSPTVRGNLVQGMLVDAVGAGMACLNGASPMIVGNHFWQNASSPPTGRGGAIACVSSSPWIIGNRFERNFCYQDPGGQGGALYLESSFAVIENNLFHGNSACDFGFGDGGALYVTGGKPKLVGNTFSGNDACQRGGAIYAGGDLEIDDTILWGNTVAFGRLLTEGAEVYALTGRTVNLSHSLIDVGTNAIAGPGTVLFDELTIHVDPLFAGATDYHLTAASPAIDAGSPSRVPGSTDGDLEPRILDGDLDGVERVDIGWDEYDWTGLTVSGTVAVGETITFDITGPAGWSYLLAFARNTGDTPLSPYGSILLGPAGLRLIGAGSLPGSDALAIPPIAALAGMPFHVQALGKAPATRIGNFSRRLDLRVQ